MRVSVEKGEDIINIISDGFVTCLKIHQPVVADWADCSGSIGRYYTISGQPEQRKNELVGHLNQVLIQGNDEQILSQIPPFLNLFASGEYLVSIQKRTHRSYTLYPASFPEDHTNEGS